MDNSEEKGQLLNKAELMLLPVWSSSSHVIIIIIIIIIIDQAALTLCTEPESPYRGDQAYSDSYMVAPLGDNTRQHLI